ncbi:MAG: sulfite exporter TauE/SafE family protein [Syntrophales bacterium]
MAALMDMDIASLLIIFVASLFSGIFGTLVGGSSLVTIPVLVLLGLPPHAAIGTDRMGVSAIGVAGLYQFHRKRLIRYKVAFILGLPSLVGSFIGANLALQISPAVMKKIIAVMTLALLAFLMVKPLRGIEQVSRPLTARMVALGSFLSLAVGVYGGFYGAGAATFLAYILIIVFGQTFLESAGTLKVGAIALSLTSALTYAAYGAIHYPLAASMFLGSFIGSTVGAYYSDRIGNVWIKRIFIGVVLIMAVKLLLP